MEEFDALPLKEAILRLPEELKAVQREIAEFLPESGMDPRWHDVTVDMALTHRLGKTTHHQF